MCVCACMHFIYLCTLPSGMQGPHLGGWDRAASPLSLPGQMAPVAVREGGALEGKKKWKEGSSQRCQSGPRPQSHHIWRPPAAGSPPSPLSSPLFPFCIQTHYHSLLLFSSFGGKQLQQQCVWADVLPVFHFKRDVLLIRLQESQILLCTELVV